MHDKIGKSLIAPTIFEKDVSNLIKDNDIVITDDWVFSWETILSTWIEVSKLNPKSINLTTQTFPWGRAWNLYKINWWVSKDILKELYDNWLVRDLPVFTWPTKNKNRLFNIEEQKILNFLLKWKTIT